MDPDQYSHVDASDVRRSAIVLMNSLTHLIQLLTKKLKEDK